MNDPQLQALIAGARTYEALFVPALTGEWASRTLSAGDVRSGDNVLDVACGTGVVAREARLRAGPHALIAGVDPNPGMLAVARELDATVLWREAAADALPFAEAAFDCVVSQFGLMFFADRGRALREMLRVLKPTGRMVVVVWGAVDSMPAYAEEIELFARLAGREAANALRAPFTLGDTALLSGMFEQAGAEASVQTLRGRGCFESIRVMVEADLTGWLPVMGVHLSREKIAEILAAAETALARFEVNGRMLFETQAHIVVARRSAAKSS